MKQIFACLDLNSLEKDRLRSIAAPDQVHIRPCLPDDAPLDPEFLSCEVCFGNPPASWIDASDKLQWVQLESVGFGEYLDLTNPPTMTNLADFFGDQVAQTALAGILTLYRGIDDLVRLRWDQQWQGDELRPTLRTLSNAQVLLFGKGAINRRLAELLKPFGCTLTSIGRQWDANSLDRAIASAEIVVTAVPDMPATRDVFGRRRIGLMRKDAIIVNLGRGTVLDESALADALDEGRLAGAVIDVTVREPLPIDHRFWTCPKLILTQHSGGGSGDEASRKLDRFADNLSRYRQGLLLTGMVDFTRGY